jgi:hypothetical protein
MEEDLAEIGKNMKVGEAAFENPQDSTQWHAPRLVVKHDSPPAGGWDRAD